MSSELYVLTVTFGNLTISDVFRVIDDNQGLFDVLVGYKTLKENKLFINSYDNYLCKMNDDETWTRIAPLSADEEVQISEDEGQTSEEEVQTDFKEDIHDKNNIGN